MDERRRRLESIVAKFNFSDSLSSAVSALTSVDAPSSDVVDLRKCQPWDRQALLQRLRTYKAATWFGKPATLSPITCASHGWINSAADTLKCPFCGEHLVYASTLRGADAAASADAFQRQLATAHDACCPWRTAAPSSAQLVAFPPAAPPPICAAFLGRVERLCALAAAPALGGKGVERLLEGAAATQLAALLQTDRVPVLEGMDEDAAALEGRSQTLSCLARRPHSFAQFVKILAMLGWDVKPLPGRQDRTASPHVGSGSCQLPESLLECSVCGSAVGLWAFAAARGTEGSLGSSGLIGVWGPGKAKPTTNLDAFTIAGGLDDSQGGLLPSQRSSDSGIAPVARRASFPPSRNGGLGRLSSSGASAPFGSSGGAAFGSKQPAPFGAAVSLAANAHRGTKSLTGGAARASFSGSGALADEAGDGERPRKKARLSLPAPTYELPRDVLERLQELGLCVSNSNPLDPVSCHRAWCPWVCSGDRAGWRQVLNAVAPPYHAHQAASAGVGQHASAPGAAGSAAPPGTPTPLRAEQPQSSVLQAANRLVQLASSVLRRSGLSPAPRAPE